MQPRPIFDASTRNRPFLTARWEYLAMLNFTVDRALLAPLVPHGTELDLWHGDAIVSLVGFRFVDTRVLGLAIPRHRDFDEINLRFYVRRRGPAGDWRRGVVFIREIVPRWLIAVTARLVYDEPYVTRRMRHQLDPAAIEAGRACEVEYAWREGRAWNALHGAVAGPPEEFAPGSEAEFITEHYWGYTTLGATRTAEYRVEHPPWRIWRLAGARFTGDPTGLYGRDLAAALGREPRSAFLARGSAVAVHHGAVIGPDDPAWPAA